MHDNDIAATGGVSAVWGPASWRDELVLRIITKLLSQAVHGRLHLVMPSGRSIVVGAGADIEAHLALRNTAAFHKALWRGSIGFAECYMNGDVETRDLGNLLRYFLANKAALSQAGGGFFKVRAPDRIYHRRRANTRSGSRRNIAAHYDLGNDFYSHWLDAGMTYSSGVFTEPDLTLEAAQAEKIARVVAAASIESGHDVLEIGCGWGSLAEHVAQLGAHVTALTISPAQKTYVEQRLRAAGLDPRVAVRLEDYRDCTGVFDRLVSVEMIEAVGQDNWGSYFRILHDLLKPGGIAVIQAITVDERIFDAYRRKADFIQRYIFPGGLLPTEASMTEHANATGLSFERVETFAASYAQTLALWRERFEAAWPQIATLGFDERFRRKWIYYLTYCEVGFQRGTIDVGHYRMCKRG